MLTLSSVIFVNTRVDLADDAPVARCGWPSSNRHSPRFTSVAGGFYARETRHLPRSEKFQPGRGKIINAVYDTF
ncbi:hypothetical protein PUN28_019848 [Cardiocondyla obscurior]|uniref:Uncharacterized protein n=1 Tax=Cardiocondyla obscurior TaxID=286306 RepID=A0AAW2E7R4_9HYME